MYYMTKPELFGRSRAETADLTYRDAWETYLEPHLKERGETRGTLADPATRAMPVEVQRGIADQMCGGRKYEGEQWWLPVIAANEGAE
jgi:hypothetical protein